MHELEAKNFQEAGIDAPRCSKCVRKVIPAHCRQELMWISTPIYKIAVGASLRLELRFNRPFSIET